MADVTISSLPPGFPAVTDVLPYSNGTNTSKVQIQFLPVSWNSMTNKPTIPAAQIQSDWNQANTGSLDYIRNKPTIPTKTSDLTNDSGFINSSSNLLPRAWFLSYGTTIQSQFNVSSITYNGASGTTAYYYTITFTNPMPNTNYTFVGTVGRSSSRVGVVGSVSIAYTDNGAPPYTNYPSLKTVTQLQISSNLSSPFIHGVIFG